MKFAASDVWILRVQGVILDQTGQGAPAQGYSLEWNEEQEGTQPLRIWRPSTKNQARRFMMENTPLRCVARQKNLGKAMWAARLLRESRYEG